MRDSRSIDLVSQKYVHLFVMQYYGRIGKKNMWICLCDCGREVLRSTKDLRRGVNHGSCGCRKRNSQATHLLSGTRIYRIWQDMKSRCYNSKVDNYVFYGGKGVTVCDEWHSFEGFFADMSSGYADDLTLDREDTNGNYCKGNCRWVNVVEQARNRKTSIWFDMNGVRKVKMDWARELGVHHNALNYRLNKGESFEQVYRYFKNKQNEN